MKIKGCEFEDAEALFVALEVVTCPACRVPQDHSGFAVFGGHHLSRDVLVWAEPFHCLYCNALIRDQTIPCGNYILELEYSELPSAR